MSRSFLVTEDTGPASRRTLFRMFGVTWAATRYAWVGPLFWCVLGVLIAATESGRGTIVRSLAVGIVYGILLFASNTLHTLGHIAAGRLAGAPMAVNVLTSTRDVNVYVQPGTSAAPKRRLARALGGPVANLTAGLAALAAAAVVGTRWLSIFGYFNVAVGLWTLAPVPSMDGWVVWGTLLHGERGHAAPR